MLSSTIVEIHWSSCTSLQEKTELVSLLSVTWLTQAPMFAWSRLYLSGNIPKRCTASSEVGHKDVWLRKLVYRGVCRRQVLGNYVTSLHIYRISKEWPVTEVKDWKGNAGIIYSISYSCSVARISREMVVILLPKNLPAARVSKLS